MARTKSEQKTGIGNAMRTYLKLIEAVEDRNGTDDDIRRIETDASLREELAKLIVVSKGVTFTFEVDYDDPRWKTIDKPHYAYVGDVKASDYPVTRTGRKRVTCRYVGAYDHEASDEEALADMARENCSQPDRPIVETFVSLNPGEPKKHPVIGLTGQVVQRLGDRDRAYVSAFSLGVRLFWRWVSLKWDQSCVFLAVVNIEDL